MQWMAAVEHLRAERLAGAIVTVASVRGHAPRNGGAKMVVSAREAWGTIGGGNLEETAIDRARALIAADAAEPELMTVQLSDKAPTVHGVQCCGGEVILLVEPIRVVPAVVIFGLGHVGLELARILSRLDLDLHLVDSRADMVAGDRLAVLDGGNARLRVHHAPVPEAVFDLLPAGTHALIMTHDHAEDVALCDVALRSPGLASIGLIGSSAKWRRFQRRLTEEGHTADELARIHTPIGVPGIASKDPAAIAVSVAAGLLQRFEAGAGGSGPAAE